MKYFKTKLRAISREYTKRDSDAIIAAAGNRCPMCNRKSGDMFTFGPTNYLKQQIRFSVSMHIHVIDNFSTGQKLVVICSGCHLSYHWFNRLSEEAVLGDKKLGETLYKRCGVCRELNCMCCKKCRNLAKWCKCSSVKTRKATRTIRYHGGADKTRRLKLRSSRRAS